MTPKAHGKYLIAIPYVKPETEKPKLILTAKNQDDEKLYKIISSVDPKWLDCVVISAGYPHLVKCDDVYYNIIKEDEVAAVVS